MRKDQKRQKTEPGLDQFSEWFVLNVFILYVKHQESLQAQDGRGRSDECAAKTYFFPLGNREVNRFLSEETEGLTLE